MYLPTGSPDAITFASKRAERLIEGVPQVLFHDGKVHEQSLADAQLTRHELMASVRGEGYADLEKNPYYHSGERRHPHHYSEITLPSLMSSSRLPSPWRFLRKEGLLLASYATTAIFLIKVTTAG